MEPLFSEAVCPCQTKPKESSGGLRPGAIQHLFCPTCGVQAFAHLELDGRDGVSSSANCLDGVDVRGLLEARRRREILKGECDG